MRAVFTSLLLFELRAYTRFKLVQSYFVIKKLIINLNKNIVSIICKIVVIPIKHMCVKYCLHYYFTVCNSNEKLMKTN